MLGPVDDPGRHEPRPYVVTTSSTTQQFNYIQFKSQLTIHLATGRYRKTTAPPNLETLRQSQWITGTVPGTVPVHTSLVDGTPMAAVDWPLYKTAARADQYP